MHYFNDGSRVLYTRNQYAPVDFFMIGRAGSSLSVQNYGPVLYTKLTHILWRPDV